MCEKILLGKVLDQEKDFFKMFVIHTFKNVEPVMFKFEVILEYQNERKLLTSKQFKEFDDLFNFMLLNDKEYLNIIEYNAYYNFEKESKVVSKINNNNVNIYFNYIVEY